MQGASAGDGETRLIDVVHLGRERVIGCWQVGEVLVDPGPESSLGAVIDALGAEPPRAVLLTHIHLDHAGGTGALLRRWPEIEVYVHERGAPHLADPAKLLASAGRLYGDDMDRLWGDVLPVPEERIHALSGGEEVLGFRVAYTPGHASHHVSFLHESSGRAFVGDIAACRVPPSGFVIPPTPPPDIDLDLWNESLDAIAAWEPSSLAITHFGEISEPVEHIAVVRERLSEQAELARGTDAEEFERTMRQQIAERVEPEAMDSLLQAVPPEQQWAGLDRYRRKRESPS
jgi:glyoxylase-like metal-dependent hydrolase (beta-lactamase superfamily II)